MLRLTQFGFGCLVIAYLAPLLGIHVYANTITTGSESEVAYFAAIFDAVLLAFAAYQAFFRGPTATVSSATKRVNDKSDTVTDFTNVAAIEWLYCLLLAFYAAVNWFILHGINKASTGALSVGSLLWSVFSIIVAILAAMQFYNLKSGKIVELSQKMVQH